MYVCVCFLACFCTIWCIRTVSLKIKTSPLTHLHVCIGLFPGTSVNALKPGDQVLFLSGKWRRSKIAPISFCFCNPTSASDCSIKEGSVSTRKAMRQNSSRPHIQVLFPSPTNAEEICFSHTQKNNLFLEGHPEVKGRNKWIIFSLFFFLNPAASLLGGLVNWQFQQVMSAVTSAADKHVSLCTFLNTLNCMCAGFWLLTE